MLLPHSSSSVSLRQPISSDTRGPPPPNAQGNLDKRERIFFELMTSDREVKASEDGSK